MRRTIPDRPRALKTGQQSHRSGNILVLTALLITFLFALIAFAVDLGYIARTKTQLQSAVDGAALAAAIELGDGLGYGPKLTPSGAASAGRTAATAVAAKNPNGNLSATSVDTASDIRFGQHNWNATTGAWEKKWDVTPYNLVQVTVRRQSGSGSAASGPLPLLFAPILGHNYSNLNETAYAALRVGVGIKIKPGSGLTADVLPIALDKPSWDALMGGVGSDNYAFNTATNVISTGSDNIKEIDLYPYTQNTLLPSGNRGTVDLGDPNNSTADLKRQILYGLNETDLAFFDGKLCTDDGPLYINGDTGISAGIKAELDAIKGQPRLIPLFTAVSGPGNNATYTIVKFVGVRILHVQLTGSNKRVIVQPCPFVSHCVVPGDAPIEVDSYFTPPRLVQ